MISLYDLNHFIRLYLRKCADRLKEQSLKETNDPTKSVRYIEFFDLELNDPKRVYYIFRKAYGSSFVRLMYNECYRIFIERQNQALRFLKKCTQEYDIFHEMRCSFYDLDTDNALKEVTSRK